jgi:hypothetical protein
MSENRVLRKKYEFRSEKGTRNCRKLQYEKLNFYRARSITTTTKQRKIRWTGHVTCMEKQETDTMSLNETLKGRDNLDDR